MRWNLCPGPSGCAFGPSAFARDQHVAPSERWDVIGQALRRLDARASEPVGVPVDYGCGCAGLMHFLFRTPNRDGACQCLNDSQINCPAQTS